MRYTVVLLCEYAYEGGDVLFLRIEADGPIAAAQAAKQHADVTRYDLTIAQAVFGGWPDNLLPQAFEWPEVEG